MGGGGTGTGEQSRSYPTTNMMDPIPITNMMGGGGEPVYGNRAGQQKGGGNRGPGTGEQSRSYPRKQGGNYHQPYHQHDGWGGEQSRSYPTTNMMDPIPITNMMGVGGNQFMGTEQVSKRGGTGGELPPTLSPTWWVGGGNGNRGTEQVSNKRGGNRGGELPATWWILSLSPTWWVGGNGDPIPITNMMGGREREQGNREGQGGEPRRSRARARWLFINY